MTNNTARKNSQRDFLLAFLAALFISFTGVWNHSLWRPDGARVAGIAAEMADSGNFIIPSLGELPFLEKPPLGYAAVALSIKLFGRSPGSTRLPGALAGLAVLLLVFDLTRRLANSRAALYAVLALSTMWGFLSFEHRCVIDVWLPLFHLAAIWSLLRSQPPETTAEAPPKSRERWLLGSYLAIGLSFLIKGPIGPVLIIGPLLIWALKRPRDLLFKSPWHLLGLAILTLMVIAWPLMLLLQDRVLFQRFVLDNILYRVIAPTGAAAKSVGFGGHKSHSVLHYAAKLPIMLLPWTFSILAAMPLLFRDALPPKWNRNSLRLLSFILFCGTLLLSLPATRRSLYLLPLLPFIAPLLGCWFALPAQHSEAPPEEPAWRRMIRSARSQKLDLLVLGVVLGAACIALLGVALILFSGHAPKRLIPHWKQLAPLPPALTLCLLAVLAVFGLILVERSRALWLKRSPALAPIVLGAALTFALIHNLTVYPLFEPLSTMSPLPARLIQEQAFKKGLVGFWLDENAQGAIYFHTGHHVRSFAGPELESYLATHQGSMVLLRDKFLSLLTPSLKQRLHRRSSWRMRRKYVYVLFECVTPKK